MQAVILCAGKGIRLRPITDKIPKPMVCLAGKPIIEHSIEALPELIDELIIVVGYLSDQIINYFGENHKGRRIKYVKQDKLLGTGHALNICKEYLGERFLVFMGDNIYSEIDIESCIKYDNCMLTKEVMGETEGGRIVFDKTGNLENIIEGKHKRESSLINAGLYVLTRDFFNYELVKLDGREEYGLPQTILKMAKEVPVKIEKASSLIQITDERSLKQAEKLLK